VSFGAHAAAGWPKHHLRDPEKYLAGWPPELYRGEAEAFYRWLKSRRDYAPRSLYLYLRGLRKVFEGLGKDPREMSYEDVLRLGLSNVDLEALKLYIRFKMETTEDPRWEKLYKRVRVPSPRRGLPEVLTREQVERLLEACGRISFELKVLVAVVYETGARVHEILLLRRRDVEFDQYGARLWIRKSKSEPRVLRVALYANLLATYIEARRPGPDEPVFPRDYSTYRQQLRRAWRLAGLPPTKQAFHTLRHTRATELLKNRTFTEKEMMLWFGWKTRSMIDVYAKVTMQDAEANYLAAVKGVDLKKEEPTRARACPRCGSLNPPEASYCLKCAAPLTPEAQRQVSNLELLLQQLLRELEELKRERAVRA
jgi:integrase/ribosomal protein L40E